MAEIIYREDLTMMNLMHIDRMIKSRRLRWAGHIVKIYKGRSDFKFITGRSR